MKLDGALYSYAGVYYDSSTPPTTISIDCYFGADPGQRLWLDSNNHIAFFLDTSSEALAGTGVLSGNVFVMLDNTHDARAFTITNQPNPPGTTPQWGPTAVWVDGVEWKYIGTVDDSTLELHADYYAGLNVGQVLSIDSLGQVQGACSGIYAEGLFLSTVFDLRALDASGLFVTPTTTPSQGRPIKLRFGAQDWHFIGSYGGRDYYASNHPGQRMVIDVSSAVTYTDRPNNIAVTSGTYDAETGTIAISTGGIAYTAGTVEGDLDILGNILSFGSLADERNTAGLTFSFNDFTASGQPSSSSLTLAMARPKANWLWAHGTNTENVAQTMMSLDSAHRLSLFDPASSTANPSPTVFLDPSPAGNSQLGNTIVSGVLIITQPAGGIGMGDFGTTGGGQSTN